MRLSSPIAIAALGAQLFFSAQSSAQVPETTAKPAPATAANPAPAPATTAGTPAPAPAPATPAPTAPAADSAPPADGAAPAEGAAPEESAAPVESAAPTAIPLTEEAEPAPAQPAPTAPVVDDGGYSDATVTTPEPQSEGPALFMLGVLWDLSIPTGSTKDFSGSVSPQGVSVTGRYRGFGNLGLGFNVAWHTLSQKTESTTTYGPATISGTQVRETSSTPLTFVASYALRDMKKAVPYAGLGFGGARVVRRLDMGISRLTDESWHWAMVPEIGVEVPLRSIDLLAAARFNYFFKSSDAPEQLYFNLSFGVGFH